LFIIEWIIKDTAVLSLVVRQAGADRPKDKRETTRQAENEIWVTQKRMNVAHWKCDVHTQIGPKVNNKLKHVIQDCHLFQHPLSVEEEHKWTSLSNVETDMEQCLLRWFVETREQFAHLQRWFSAQSHTVFFGFVDVHVPFGRATLFSCKPQTPFVGCVLSLLCTRIRHPPLMIRSTSVSSFKWYFSFRLSLCLSVCFSLVTFHLVPRSVLNR